MASTITCGTNSCSPDSSAILQAMMATLNECSASDWLRAVATMFHRCTLLARINVLIDSTCTFFLSVTGWLYMARSLVPLVRKNAPHIVVPRTPARPAQVTVMLAQHRPDVPNVNVGRSKVVAEIQEHEIWLGYCYCLTDLVLRECEQAALPLGDCREFRLLSDIGPREFMLVIVPRAAVPTGGITDPNGVRPGGPDHG